jgi:hypothetical protein
MLPYNDNKQLKDEGDILKTMQLVACFSLEFFLQITYKVE